MYEFEHLSLTLTHWDSTFNPLFPPLLSYSVWTSSGSSDYVSTEAALGGELAFQRARALFL